MTAVLIAIALVFALAMAGLLLSVLLGDAIEIDEDEVEDLREERRERLHRANTCNHETMLFSGSRICADCGAFVIDENEIGRVREE